MANCDALIVGAGPAGLACAQAMRAIGLNPIILDKAGEVAASWRRHYDRLHLHTDRNHSGLPGMAMPKAYPTYPSCAQVIEYLEHYAERFGIRPEFNAESYVSPVMASAGSWTQGKAGPRPSSCSPPE